MSGPVRQPSQGAKYSLYYITAGTLIMIWSGIWFYYLKQNQSESNGLYYVCTGLLLSGLALLVIGILVGKIGREGKQADITVPQVVHPTPVVSSEVETANGHVVGGNLQTPVQTTTLR